MTSIDQGEAELILQARIDDYMKQAWKITNQINTLHISTDGVGHLDMSVQINDHRNLIQGLVNRLDFVEMMHKTARGYKMQITNESDREK